MKIRKIIKQMRKVSMYNAGKSASLGDRLEINNRFGYINIVTHIKGAKTRRAIKFYLKNKQKNYPIDMGLSSRFYKQSNVFNKRNKYCFKKVEYLIVKSKRIRFENAELHGIMERYKYLPVVKK